MSDSSGTAISDTVDHALNEGRPRGRFSAAVRKFVAAVDWLDDEHAPALAALEGAAEELDRRVTGAMLSQYNAAFRLLRSQAPGASGEDDDPVQAALDAARNG